MPLNPADVRVRFRNADATLNLRGSTAVIIALVLGDENIPMPVP